MLTRGHPTVHSGRETKCARLLIDLTGSTRRSALIYKVGYASIPADLERFTRFRSDLDDDTKTTRDRVAV